MTPMHELTLGPWDLTPEERAEAEREADEIVRTIGPSHKWWAEGRANGHPDTGYHQLRPGLGVTVTHYEVKVIGGEHHKSTHWILHAWRVPTSCP